MILKKGKGTKGKGQKQTVAFWNEKYKEDKEDPGMQSNLIFISDQN